jgi:hypothetical protein
LHFLCYLSSFQSSPQFFFHSLYSKSFICFLSTSYFTSSFFYLLFCLFLLYLYSFCFNLKLLSSWPFLSLFPYIYLFPFLISFLSYYVSFNFFPISSILFHSIPFIYEHNFLDVIPYSSADKRIGDTNCLNVQRRVPKQPAR